MMSDEPIIGHQTEDVQSCSSCHGGASQSYIEAAHGPKKGIHVVKPLMKNERNSTLVFLWIR